jgi:hypothetical protein
MVALKELDSIMAHCGVCGLAFTKLSKVLVSKRVRRVDVVFRVRSIHPDSGDVYILARGRIGDYRR